MQLIDKVLKNKKLLAILFLIAISFIVRFFYLGYPSEIVFDEVHFGKFISAYFTHEYYFDIHPPLGKMLIAGFAKLCGYTPGFDFDHIGEMFDAKNLLILRFLPALFGALLPLVIYLILRQLKISPRFALLGGLFTVFDNALLVESKFILVDSMLIFFGFFSIYLYLLYNSSENYRKKLVLLGLSAIFAGFSLSIKWTGVLFLGVIGLSVLYKYFRKFNLKLLAIDLSILIFIPLIIYYLVFSVHLALLFKSGSGDGYMSEKFQNTLIKNNTEPQKMPQFARFIELNKQMYFYNSTLKATHSFGSVWYQWPIGKRPIWFWAGSKDNAYANIYLMGNIVEWLLVLAGIAFSVYLIFSKKMKGKLPFYFWFLFIGYFANLLPYMAITRVTFLYHYLPSLVFGIMIFCIILDKIIALKINKPIYYGILSLIVVGFLLISPISYGFKISEKANSFYTHFVNIFL